MKSKKRSELDSSKDANLPTGKGANIVLHERPKVSIKTIAVWEEISHLNRSLLNS
jgi:hypothetical protein